MVKKSKRLGEMLLEAGLINEVQLKRALERQKSWGGRLGSNLVMTGAIKDDDLIRFIAAQTGIKEMDISSVEVLPHVLKKIPKKIVEQYHMVPIAMKEKNKLIVACADPTDLGALDQLAFISGHSIEPVVASYTSILNQIRRLYSNDDNVLMKNGAVAPDREIGGQAFIEMAKMEEHGGVAPPEDPELVIFGNQTTSSEALEEPQTPLSARPLAGVSSEIELDQGARSGEQSKAGEFSLDFAPAHPREERIPQVSTDSFTFEQKLQGLYSVLIKKKLVTEDEVEKELMRLWSLGKLN